MEESIKLLEECNLWGDTSIYLGFPRVAYTDSIQDYVGNRLVKVPIGELRSGKSYTIRQIDKSLIDNGVDKLFYVPKLCEF